MPLHYLAWKSALCAWGCEFSKELFYAWGGLSVTDIIKLLNEKHGLQMPVESVVQRKEECYFESLPKLKAVPDFLEHIESSCGRISLAVVSGSKRDSVTASLTFLGLLEKFQVLVCAEDYTRGKPDPEPFLLATTKLGVDPHACLVFEDTEMGIQAAQAAGMTTVKVPPARQRSLNT